MSPFWTFGDILTFWISSKLLITIEFVFAQQDSTHSLKVWIVDNICSANVWLATSIFPSESILNKLKRSKLTHLFPSYFNISCSDNSVFNSTSNKSFKYCCATFPEEIVGHWCHVFGSTESPT